MRNLPHALTLFRLVAAPVVALLLLRSEFGAALALVVAAGLTDWLDGYTARRLGVAGRFGVVLDPLADKVLLVTLFLALAGIRLIPLWLLVLVVGRDVLIVLGALLWRLLWHVVKFLPSMLGKVSTFFQIVFVLLVLLEAALPNRLFDGLARVALVLTAFFTAASGVDYARRAIIMARSVPAAAD